MNRASSQRLRPLQKPNAVPHILRRVGLQQIQKQPDLLLNRVPLTGHDDDPRVSRPPLQVFTVELAEILRGAENPPFPLRVRGQSRRGWHDSRKGPHRFGPG